MAQVIVVGGGLAGLSAAHTVLERGGNVLVLEKNALMGGNSTKATSGINGALTKTQIEQGVHDSEAADTALSASRGASDVPSELAKVLVAGSAPAVRWLQDSFGLDLSLLGRLGGHSFPRTHRGKERFPGMTITYALMERIEEIAEQTPNRARVITKARVTRLLTENGAVVGVEYETRDGQKAQERGPVVIATGGYGADFTPDSILMKVRPDIGHLPTTNGEHCTGDGIRMSQAIGADLKDIECVQVHPTGLVDPKEPNAKVKFLAAEALRGVGGLMLDGDGKRFCNELGRRDYVSGKMAENKGPFRGASKDIEWHCKHYHGRGLFKKFDSGAALAKEIGCSPATLEKTFADYRKIAETKNDPLGRKSFDNYQYCTMSDNFYVGIVTPVVHYTMGGLRMTPDSAVADANGNPIPGLFAAGEVMGGVHGLNRLGGSSLLDCVVFGRVSGNAVSAYFMNQLSSSGPVGRAGAVAGHLTGQPTLNININWGGASSTVSVGAPAAPAPVAKSTPPTASAPAPAPSTSVPAAAPAAPAGPKVYSAAEVGKHNTEDDCWVIVNGQVLNVTDFLEDHPGGKKSIMLFAGRDASEEFNMLHKPTVIKKYAPDAIIGTIEGAAPNKTMAKF